MKLLARAAIETAKFTAWYLLFTGAAIYDDARRKIRKAREWGSLPMG